MRNKVMVGWMSAAVLAVSAPSVFAQSTTGDADDARCTGTTSTGAGPRDQTFCFTGTTVAGDAVGPNDPAVRTLRPAHGTSLLRLRAHFVPEMLKSAESL